MKNLILLSFMLTLCISIQAQITINHWDHTLDLTGDTLFLTGLDPANATIPQGGVDMVWDYSGIAITTSTTTEYNVASDADFPNSNLGVNTTYTILGLVTLPGQNHYTLNNQGFYDDGRTNMAIGIPLISFTGNSADTIFTSDSPQKESNPIPYIEFPLDYGNTSTTTSTASNQYIGNVAAFGLSNYGVKEQYTTVSSIDVSGWGKLILTDPTTMQPDTFEVLLQKRTRSNMMNYLDDQGNATSPTLLGAFGITDSVMTNITYHYFYAKGVNRFTFLIYEQDGMVTTMSQNDEAFTKAFNVNAEEVKPLSVSHRVYPNPVQNNQFQLELDKNNSADWTLEVYNLVGQTVHQASITDNNSSIYLDNNLTTGHYLYTVKNENGQVIANGKLAL